MRLERKKNHRWKQIACVNYGPFSRNCIRGILSTRSSINYVAMKLHCIQQYQYPGNFISKDRQLKQNRGQWNTKQRESHWLKHLKAREWETREGKEKDWLHFTCQWHAAGALLCVCVRMCVSVCLCLKNCTAHVCTNACVWCVCTCCCVCYAWRHTCSNRVVVDSDSCPVPFTAQSSQPPLCSVRLLMRINVLWRPLGLPHSHPHTPTLNGTANEEIQPCQNTEVRRESDTDRERLRDNMREGGR